MMAEADDEAGSTSGGVAKSPFLKAGPGEVFVIPSMVKIMFHTGRK
jgi:hypothetical protein